MHSLSLITMTYLFDRHGCCGLTLSQDSPKPPLNPVCADSAPEVAKCDPRVYLFHEDKIKPAQYYTNFFFLQ